MNILNFGGFFYYVALQHDFAVAGQMSINSKIKSF